VQHNTWEKKKNEKKKKKKKKIKDIKKNEKERKKYFALNEFCLRTSKKVSLGP